MRSHSGYVYSINICNENDYKTFWTHFYIIFSTPSNPPYYSHLSYYSGLESTPFVYNAASKLNWAVKTKKNSSCYQLTNETVNCEIANKTLQWLQNERSSHWRCSIKKVVLKNFAIFTGKHLCWSFFLINCIKKRFQYKYFPGSIVKLLRTLLWRASANDCFYRSEEGREGRLFYKNEKKSLTGILKSCCLKIEISILP